MTARHLDLATLRRLNVSRAHRWHGAELTSEHWSLADWGNAAAGEVGAACNVVKKLRRIEAGYPGPEDGSADQLRRELATEIADAVTYLDLLAAAIGIDLAGAIADKFNRVSERQGFPERILAPSSQDSADLDVAELRGYVEHLEREVEIRDSAVVGLWELVGNETAALIAHCVSCQHEHTPKWHALVDAAQLAQELTDAREELAV